MGGRALPLTVARRELHPLLRPLGLLWSLGLAASLGDLGPAVRREQPGRLVPRNRPHAVAEPRRVLPGGGLPPMRPCGHGLRLDRDRLLDAGVRAAPPSWYLLEDLSARAPAAGMVGPLRIGL